MDDALLQVKGLSLGFRTRGGARQVIDNISFAIQSGQTLALVGESGCGKSLTALSILHLLPAQAALIGDASIVFQGEDISQYTPTQMQGLRGNDIAMIFQEPMTSLNPVLTVGEQVAEVLWLHKRIKGKKARARVIALFEQVRIPEPALRFSCFPHQLSGGLKQRVMIAMALAGEPKLLIADEPTTALDVTIQAQVLSLLNDIQAETGMSILLITHDLAVVRQMADEVAVMYAGHLVEQASCDDFFSAPSHPYSQRLFDALPSINKRDQHLAVLEGDVPPLTQQFSGCRFAPRCQYKEDTCEQISPSLLSTSESHRVRCHRYDVNFAALFPARDTTLPLPITHEKKSGKSLLHVRELAVHFPIQKGLFQRQVGSVKAVDGASLTLYEGKTLALVGESGCGKTTLGRAILQLVNATSGHVRYHQHSLLELSKTAMDSFRRELQIIFQDPFSSMNPRMLVHDIIAEGLHVFQPDLTGTLLTEYIVGLLTKVGLPRDALWRYPHEFSGGQRQRICIARALAVEPKILVCDEPTSALDISVQAQILNLLRSLQQTQGHAYLFITHNISVVAYLADEVAVMYLGRIVEYGRVKSILAEPKHPYTVSLLEAVPSIEQPDIISTVSGEMPSPVSPPSGCHFHPRCGHAMDICKKRYPEQITIEDGRTIRCHLFSNE